MQLVQRSTDGNYGWLGVWKHWGWFGKHPSLYCCVVWALLGNNSSPSGLYGTVSRSSAMIAGLWVTALCGGSLAVISSPVYVFVPPVMCPSLFVLLTLSTFV